jgi:hypothetical protein
MPDERPREVFPSPRRPGVSGRLAVAGVLLAIAAVMGTVAFFFRGFRAEYARTAEWGLGEVVPLVEGFRPLAPPGTPPEEWGAAVDASRELMRRVVTCGLLDRARQEGLRADLAARVARTRPEAARAELILLWADMLTAAGPRLSAGPGAEGTARFPALDAPESMAGAIRHAMTVDRLLPIVPDGTTRGAWEQAVAETRRLLAYSDPSPTGEESARLAARVGKATPETAKALLGSLWDEREGAAGGLARPELLGEVEGATRG